jgi:hypothetical protein
MTNIYSLFPARREETLFRDHNLIAFFVSRLSKSNLRVHRVRFERRLEVLQNNNFKKTKDSMPASGPMESFSSINTVRYVQFLCKAGAFGVKVLLAIMETTSRPQLHAHMLYTLQ